MESDAVVVYCSVDVAFARPILREFERRGGIRVHPVFDTEAGKTTGLVNKLIAERSRPRADVWWSGEIFGTIELARHGALEPYDSPSAADIPPRYRDPARLWTAFALRARVLAYDPGRTKPDDLPRRWCDLADPRFRDRLAMADPRFGTTRGHMAALLSLWGEAAMKDFYAGLKENGCRLTDGNSKSVLLLTRGLVEAAATDTDDVIAAQLRGDSVDMIYPDCDAPPAPAPLARTHAARRGHDIATQPASPGHDGPHASNSPKSAAVPGTLWIPNSAALVRGSPRPQAARRLLDYLLSAEIEKELARSDSRNVPVRPALRDELRLSAPAQAAIDYAAAAKALARSDELVATVLLR